MNSFDNIDDNPLRTTEMSMEQNYNMIDGIINNLPPDTDEQEHKADVPPEHSVEEDKYNEVLPMIAETLDMSVSQVKNLPEELREMAAIAYMNNTDMPKEDLKELLSNTLELTPQAADIHIDSPKRERIEPAVETKSVFSRAAQKDFTEKAAERSESPDNTQNKNKNNDRQITL